MSDPAAVAARALAHHPILDGVDAAVRTLILREGRVELFPAGKLLSKEGDAANDYWFLCSGSVRVFYASPDGFEVTVKIFSAPAAWAEMEVLTGHPHIEDCMAVDASVVVRLDRNAFERVMALSPKFMRNVLYDTCARFLIAAQHERALAFLPVQARLANLLLTYVRMYGVPVADGTGIRVRLSHADLANGLGVARRSIARTLTQWVKEGLLGKSGTSYVVKNMAGLSRFATHDIVGIDWVAGSNIQEGRGVKPRQRRTP